MAVEHARDAAWFGGRPTAVGFVDGRVREWRFDGRAWQPDPANDRAIPPGLEVGAMHVDGQPLRGDDRLVFLPDGLGIPFSIALASRGYAWAVEGDAAGAVRLVER
jgi:general secretion pathway protein H